MSDRDLIARLATALRVQLDGVNLYSDLLAEADAHQGKPGGGTMSGDRLRSSLAELVRIIERHGSAGIDDFDVPYVAAAMTRARALLAEAQPAEPGQLSDGYHTFDELYEHRHALCLALMRAMPGQWWFSRRHADGEMCFSKGEWFIVGVDLHIGHSITYHLPIRLWEAAQATGAGEVERAPHWDGHTAADVVERLKAYAAGGLAEAQPEPVEPTDEQIESAFREWWKDSFGFPYFGAVPLVACVEWTKAAMARWGRPAPEPVSVTERLPTAQDCDKWGRCWHWDPFVEHSCWVFMPPIDYPNGICTHWLPHWALPVPLPTTEQ